MKYKCKKIVLEHPIGIWKQFEMEEKILFQNAAERELLIGVRRHTAIPAGGDCGEYPYTLGMIPFFGSDAGEKWQRLGNEWIAFEFYFVFRDGAACVYYIDEPPKIQDIPIEKRKHEMQKSHSDYMDWMDMFENIKREIRRGIVEKVVLSREVEFISGQKIRIESVLQNLLEQNRDSFVFAYQRNDKTFLGATPEILVSKKHNQIKSYALAGTIAKNGKQDELLGKQLLADQKNNREHRIVVDAIAGIMKNAAGRVRIGKTELLELKNLFHLKTELTAENDSFNLLQWAGMLHPTPAMGGEPKGKAMELIRTFETHDRGMFAAPIGIIDKNGDGIFVVGIRSALIEENKVYAYAGCGIIEQSDCRDEYEETDHKLRTILEAL